MSYPSDPVRQAFWEAIQSRVCRVCLDQKDDGTCGLTRRVCAIDTHLPRLVEVLAEIESDRMDEYVAAVEDEICAGCDNLGAGERCALRDGGECALYAYMPLVVEAIEEVLDGRKGRTA